MNKLLVVGAVAATFACGGGHHAQRADAYSDTEIGNDNRDVRDDDPALGRDDQQGQHIQGAGKDLTDDQIKERVQGLTDDDMKDDDVRNLKDDDVKSEANRAKEQVKEKADDASSKPAP